MVEIILCAWQEQQKDKEACNIGKKVIEAVALLSKLNRANSKDKKESRGYGDQSPNELQDQV